MKKTFLFFLHFMPFLYCFSQNIGIGTTAPASKLHVVGSTSDVAIFSGGNSMYITLAEGTNYRGYIGSYYGNTEDVDFGTYSTNATGRLHLVTGQNIRLTVAAGGNIGIGTVTPLQKLEVTGAIRIGNTSTNVEGSLRYNNGKFEGHTTNNWASFDQLPTGTLVASRHFPNEDLEDQGYLFRGAVGNVGVMEIQQGVGADSWLPTAVKNTIDPSPGLRPFVYTGTAALFWGGESNGQRYDPTRNVWSAISITNEPAPRLAHSIVWTGMEMIIWGGTGTSSGFLSNGGRYNPLSDTWTGMSTVNSPGSRLGQTAVWTGTEMIVWGGFGPGIGNTGAKYNPATNTWTAMSTTNAPVARDQHSAVWTGSEMIIWGGEDAGNIELNNGAKYNPSTNTWTSISQVGAPSARTGHTAIWTGTGMLIWGGTGGNTGAIYTPASNSWPQVVSLTNAPDVSIDRYTAVWTGNDMIIWGGNITGGPINTGKKYRPSTNTWTNISSTNAPSPRYSATGFWTGREMVIFSGSYPINGFMKSGGRYFPDAQPSFQAPYETPGAFYLYSKQ